MFGDVSFISKCLITTGLGAGLVFMFRRLLFGKSKWCTNNISLIGKTALITGANTGIGKATAIALAKRKCRVILACRDITKATMAADEIRRTTNGLSEVMIKHLDLASLKSVRSFSDDILTNETKIDILINNAGIYQCPFWKTEDGFEMQFGVNHLGHFLLTNLLLPKLEAAGKSRIIVVSSSLYKRAKIDFDNLNAEKMYNKAYAYSHSKLANLLFSHELSKRLPTGITVNSVHPGVVWTELGRHVITGFLKKTLFPVIAYLLLKTPFEGAQTIVYLATEPSLEFVSGKYFGNCKMEDLLPAAEDDAVSKQLWEVSEKMTLLK